MRKPTCYPRRSATEWQQLRQQAAERFSQGQSITQIVQAVNVSYEAVRVWRRRWEEGGNQNLLQRPPRGRRPKLSAQQLQELERELLNGPRYHGYATEVWTLERMAKLISKLFGVSYHPCHVFKILRAMGWSCQKPARQAKQRDEQAIRRWLTQRWPQVKGGRN